MNKTGVPLWYLLIVFLFALFLAILFNRAGFSQGQSAGQLEANLAVKNIWGEAGFARKSGRNYQVGCTVSGNTIVVASSQKDYPTALLAVNLKINGAHVITATARDVAGNTADSAPVTVILCNAQ